jgi:hypothetical protein
MDKSKQYVICEEVHVNGSGDTEGMRDGRTA